MRSNINKQNWLEAATEWACPQPEYRAQPNISHAADADNLKGRLFAQTTILVFLPACALLLLTWHGHTEHAAAIFWALNTAIAVYLNRIGRTRAAVQIFLNASFLVCGLNWIGDSNRYSLTAEFDLIVLCLCSAFLLNSKSPRYYGITAALMIAFQCVWHRVSGGYTIYTASAIISNLCYHSPFALVVWGISNISVKNTPVQIIDTEAIDIDNKILQLEVEAAYKHRIALHLQRLVSKTANLIDQDSILQQIVDSICEIGYAGGAILIFDFRDTDPDNPGTLSVRSHSGIDDKHLLEILTANIDKDWLLNGVPKRSRIDQESVSIISGESDPALKQVITEQVCVPIRFQNRVLGAMLTWSAQDRNGILHSERLLQDPTSQDVVCDPFDETALSMISALADHAALALGYTLRHEEMQHEHRRLGMENETAIAQAEELVLSNQQLMTVQTILAAQYQTLEAANEQLAGMATTDGMTGLANHRSFQEELARQVARTQRSHVAHSLLMMDVDKFKQYNDTYGHPAGDEVLKEVAKVIRGVIRDGDFPARYGGEEFAVILPDTELETAAQIGERIRAAVAAHKFLFIEITVSVGATQFVAVSPNTTIQRADVALYRAKKEGRNRLVINPYTADSESQELPARELTAEGSSWKAPTNEEPELQKDAVDEDYVLTASDSRSPVTGSVQKAPPAISSLPGRDSILSIAYGGLEGLLQESSNQVLDELVKALDQHSSEPVGHSERLARYTLKLGNAIAETFSEQRENRPLLPVLNPGDMAQFAMGALLHDIGNIGIPENVLRKTGKLTKEEWRLVRRHPLVGSEMVARHYLLSRALPIVRYHHERWDGGGYPEGRIGEAIPIGARIFAVCDALDSLTTEKSYRPKMDFEQAMNEIVQGSGSQFDPDVVEAFVKIPIAEWQRLSQITDLSDSPEIEVEVPRAA